RRRDGERRVAASAPCIRRRGFRAVTGDCPHDHEGRQPTKARSCQSHHELVARVATATKREASLAARSAAATETHGPLTKLNSELVRELGCTRFFRGRL